MEAALKAIAAPRRRRILSLVRDGEMSAGEIAAHFDVTRPAVSQHLNVLKEAGLVSERRNGTKRLYSVRLEGLLPIVAFLEGFWDDAAGRALRVVASIDDGGSRAFLPFTDSFTIDPGGAITEHSAA